MTDAAFTDQFALSEDRHGTRAPKAHWPLMGDIVSHRAGVPEHLLLWRRAEAEADPQPMLVIPPR